MKKTYVVTILLLGLMVFSSFSFAAEKNNEKSIVKIGGDVVVPWGEEIEDAVAVGGSVTVEGTVSDAVAVGGSVYLKSSARVKGDAVSIGGEVVIEEGAVVSGDIVEVSPIQIVPFAKGFKEWGVKWGIGGMILARILVFVGFLALALLFTALFSKYIGVVSAQTEGQWLRTFLWGVLGLILVSPIVILLAISILGIPLIPLFLIVFLAALILGYIAVAQLVGKKITIAFRKPNQPMILEVIIGMLLLGIVCLIPIIGWFIRSIVATLGLGGVILTKFGTKA